MVARALAAHCAARGDQVFAHARDTLDITNAPDVRAVFERERPETVINCAAWTNVDGCELNPERAILVNAEAVETLAAASRLINASFVTISTDYVFDGSKPAGFYTQRDDPAPQSAYGLAKLQGERRAARASARTIVVRTGWIFGAGGRNFLATAAARARRGEPLKAISDAYGTPTYAPDTYHVVNAGDGTSYLEFAREAARAAGVGEVEIESVSMDSLARPAPRPRNSRLRCLLSEAIGLVPLPDWRDALREFAENEAGSGG